MARRKKNARKEITNYAHTDEQRVNNPPVGLVTPDTDKDAGKKAITESTVNPPPGHPKAIETM